MISEAIVLALVGLAGTAIGANAPSLWQRRKSKAEAFKATAEGEKTHAEAERIKLETSITRAVDAATKDLRSAVADIRHEVKPNHGTSIKDAVKRLEDGVNRVEKRQQEDGATLSRLEGMLDVAAVDRANLHSQIDAVEQRQRDREDEQRERELAARREHDDFREKLLDMKAEVLELKQPCA